MSDVAILGAGNGGFAFAADLQRRGLQATLFEIPGFAGSLDALKSADHMHLTGVFGDQVVPAPVVELDIEAAVHDAPVVVVVVPAFAHELFARLCAPHLTAGQVVILTPGSTGGALEWARVVKEAAGRNGALLAETLNMPYASRKTGPREVHIAGFKTNLPIAALPGGDVAAVIGRAEHVFPAGLRPARDVFETGLNNMNAMAHPVPILLSAGWIEATGGAFKIYSDAVTESVARAMDAVDAERMAVAEALGLEAVSLAEWDRRLYGLEGANTYELIHNSWVHRDIAAPDQLEGRGLTEDVPYGLVPIASIGAQIGIPTPACDLFITLASMLLGRDLRATGRTVKSLGLQGMSSREMVRAVACRPPLPRS